MPQFDTIAMVDWSAANVPTTGANSIWIAVAGRGKARSAPFNPPTRHQAMAVLSELARRTVASRERLLVGFDFAFGYPAGTERLFGDSWRAIWAWIASAVRDDETNASNRFDVARRFNDKFGPEPGPLWGAPGGRDMDGVPARRPDPTADAPPERRQVETIVRGASPVWKLAYPGSVGSQTLLGIAALEKLRTDLGDHVRVWPFETDFERDLDAPVILAEIYPSQFGPPPLAEGEVLDAGQVRMLADRYAALDAADGLIPHLSGPRQSTEQRKLALNEEGWIMSAGMAA